MEMRDVREDVQEKEEVELGDRVTRCCLAHALRLMGSPLALCSASIISSFPSVSGCGTGSLW